MLVLPRAAPIGLNIPSIQTAPANLSLVVDSFSAAMGRFVSAIGQFSGNFSQIPTRALNQMRFTSIQNTFDGATRSYLC